MVSSDHMEDYSPERPGDIIQTQPVELNSPMGHEEETFFPQIGGGYRISHIQMLELQHNHLSI